MKAFGFQILSRYWRVPRLIWGLFVLEFGLTVAILALFGIADPNTYRTKLWQEGANHGWNSNPNEILYSYANHNPINTPLVWSQFITNYNVVISVLSMFLLLTKTTMMVMRVFFPPISVLVHGVLVAIYSFSVYGQSAHDLSDPKHKQTGAPWYITKSCSVSSTSSIKGYCQQAKAAFSLTVIMLALFLFHMLWALFSNFTAKKPIRSAANDDDEPQARAENKNFSPESNLTNEQQWELEHFRRQGLVGDYGYKNNPEAQPFTPRTQAFHTLGGGGDLPLRQS